MKIKLITFHTPKNYGAVLQAFSLFSYLKEIYEDVKVIDFNTMHLRGGYPILRIPKSIKSMIVFILLLPFIPKKIIKYKKFDNFIREKLILTKKYEAVEELYNEKWEDDIIVTGSDQVFNPNRIIAERKAFYLDFVPQSIKKVSYAGSFGVSQISDEKKNEIKNYLNDFDMISVREESGINIVSDLVNKPVKLVLDPVFLHNKQFWQSISVPYKKSFSNYLLYYRLMGAKTSDEAAQKIAKEKGLQIIVVTEGMVRFRADKVLRDVGPEELLYLMNNADFVVTDSFHGVAFSIILQKQFWSLPVMEDKMDRQKTILSICGLNDRIYPANKLNYTNIDYNLVNKKLEKMIEYSKKYITNIVDIE